MTQTQIDPIEDGIYRIHTPVPAMPGGFAFSFNQYLIVDDEPLLFHTGLRRLFPAVRDAIAKVMPIEKLRWVAFGHVEADECGGLNDLLAAAPNARPLCSRVAALVSINDLADREARAVADGELISLGRHQLRWTDTPHLPHGWESGLLLEETTRTLLCGDLFTQPGAEHAPVVEDDILTPSEKFRTAMDYAAHGRDARKLVDKLAAFAPRTLACMHGSAWRGDGGSLLRTLGAALS